jgi:hypothetical protein
MITQELDQQENDLDHSIRKREIEVFDAFMARALSIVRKQDDHNTSIADACRLVDTALRAARGDGSMPGVTTAADNGLKGLIEELHTGYEERRAAQAAGESTTGEGEL